MDSPSENGKQHTPTITVTFTPDGQMGLHAEGVGPPQLWAAARLLETWGDSEFAAQLMAAQERGSKLALPGKPGIRRIGS